MIISISISRYIMIYYIAISVTISRYIILRYRNIAILYCNFAILYCDIAIAINIIIKTLCPLLYYFRFILRYRDILYCNIDQSLIQSHACMHTYSHAARWLWQKNLSAGFAIRGPVARTGANYDTRNSISFFSPFSQFFLSSRYHSFVPATVNLIGINFSPRISSSGKKAIPCKNYISV